jgi:hypothetical protein
VPISQACSSCRKDAPVPESACKLIFHLITKGCVRGSAIALDLFERLLDTDTSQPSLKAAMYDLTVGSEPQPELQWIPSDNDLLEVSSDHWVRGFVPRFAAKRR